MPGDLRLSTAVCQRHLAVAVMNCSTRELHALFSALMRLAGFVVAVTTHLIQLGSRRFTLSPAERRSICVSPIWLLIITFYIQATIASPCWELHAEILTITLAFKCYFIYEITNA